MDISEDKIKILNDLDKNTVTIINGEAGTGKTLIGSLGGQKMLEGSKNWEKALYLTYSKLAKRQIKYTIKKLCVENHLKADFIKKMEVMNYHSFWWHLINKYYCFLGIPRKPILSTKSELNSLIEEVFRKIPKEIIPKKFLTTKNEINKNKEKNIKKNLAGLGSLYYNFGAEFFGKDAKDYVKAQHFLKWSNAQIFDRNYTGCFSHDETVCWVHKLLTAHPNVSAIIREKYPVFIFDEFQDTDIAQWEIIKLLKPKTIIVLADPAQTIHQWRGADPERIKQLIEFCRDCNAYIRVESKLLKTKHRSSKNMSAPGNIDLITVGDDFDPKDAKEFNKLKLKAKSKCKRLSIDYIKQNKNIAVLCLTNKLANAVTDFFRTRQVFKNGNSVYPIRCSRYGADYSPFENARGIILEILNRNEERKVKEIQEYLANTVFRDLLPQKIDRCSNRSHKNELKKRWELAVRLSDIFLNNFGDGLEKLRKFIVYIEKRVKLYCDSAILNIFKKVGESIQKLSANKWDSFSLYEKRIKVDSLILQYENAVSEYKNDKVSIMTVHQAKGQEFDNVIVFWFSTIPWDKSDGNCWDTCNESQENLFHTACTRARNNVFVITPKGFTPPWPP